MSFRVELESYRGPVDLLLYLVRRHEIDVGEIPLSLITGQFQEYLEILEQLDVNSVGDFVEMASMLIELKSRHVLPRADEETEEIEDPRQELVQRLLEYKKYKDAASMLDEQSRQWQQRFSRVAGDLPPRPRDPAAEPIQEVELWDLVSSFGRIVRDTKTAQASSIVYDDTPIHVHMERIHEKLQTEQRVAFSHMFHVGMHKSAVIGVFLAILELVRHHRVRTQQDEAHGEIWILAGETIANPLDIEEVDNYDAAADETAPKAK